MNSASTTIPYRGVFPVAPTIFHDQGRLDLEGQHRCIDFMIDASSYGICILANFSEQFALSDEERELLAKSILNHVAGRVPVIVTTTTSARISALLVAVVLKRWVLPWLPLRRAIGAEPLSEWIVTLFSRAKHGRIQGRRCGQERARSGGWRRTQGGQSQGGVVLPLPVWILLSLFFRYNGTVFDPDAHLPKLNRSLICFGACLIAGCVLQERNR